MLFRSCLNSFFSISDAACRKCEYDEPQSTLMHTDDVNLIQARTTSPVDEQCTRHWPFVGFNTSQVIDFAMQHLDRTDLSPANMVVLDERSNEDQTCILLSRNTLSDDGRDYVQVRADFESAVIVLKTIETGCGDGDSQLDMNYAGFDGVLRISVQHR